jgi:hypothetical protein
MATSVSCSPRLPGSPKQRRNLVMDLQDAGYRTNSSMERWVLTCRGELLDRTLIWSQRHLLHTLRQCGILNNDQRPRQGIDNARPLAPSPEPITDPDLLSRLESADEIGAVASCTSSSMPPELRGCISRQGQGWARPGWPLRCPASLRTPSPSTCATARR